MKKSNVWNTKFLYFTCIYMNYYYIIDSNIEQSIEQNKNIYDYFTTQITNWNKLYIDNMNWKRVIKSKI